MSEAEDEALAQEKDDAKLKDYYEREEEARAKGLDTIVSVRLKVPPELEHVLDPLEAKEVSVVVWVSSKCSWPVVMEKIEKMHAPMIVRWVLPIGKVPKLLEHSA